MKDEKRKIKNKYKILKIKEGQENIWNKNS